MKNLLKPAYEKFENDLKTALKQHKYKGEMKGYTATNEEISHILQIYSKYEENFSANNAALKASELAADLRTALLKAYDLTQKNRKLKHIRETVFSDIALCPICGITAPSEIDHFLPSSEYNALAIFVHNLVPLCHDCNSTKLAAEPELGKSRYLHAYFDEIPAVQLLHAKVHIKDNGLLVNFTVADDINLDANLFENLSYQLRQLKINTRYTREINTYLSGLSSSLHMIFAKRGRDGVSKYLNIQGRNERAGLYPSHWRPTLLDALAQNEEFCNGGFTQVLPIADDLLGELVELIN